MTVSAERDATGDIGDEDYTPRELGYGEYVRAEQEVIREETRERAKRQRRDAAYRSAATLWLQILESLRRAR
jgi:hypothetical protein